MANQGGHQAARFFASAFAESLAASLTQAAGLPWQIKVLERSDLSAQSGEAIHFRLTVEGALQGSFFIEFYELEVKELASKVDNSLLPVFEERGEALKKLISSAAEGLAASLSAEFGLFTCTAERVSGLAFGGMQVFPLAAFEGEQPRMSLALYFDGSLLSDLAAHESGRGRARKRDSSLDPLNLNIVMDVELNVSLRFGQRQLPLREVLELTSGSVVELDRLVDDPVELLLDGKVIARGEAVIVDGNYGLRVTEIPQPIASHFAR